MAQRVTTTVTDDIDGSKNAETVTFSLDGADYEIDLAKKNAAALRKSLAEFVGVARSVGSAGASGKPGRRRTARSAPAVAKSGTKVDVRAVREWAAANGIPTSSRGRIAASVVEQYQNAER